MRASAVSLALGVSFCASAVWAEPPLAPLSFLEGCWVGSFAEPEGLKDERCFTFVYGGHYLRDVHTVVGAGYGGESIIAWDAERQSLNAHYYASDGGLMEGAVVIEAEGIWLPNARYIGADGSVQFLRSRWTREGDRSFRVVTEREEGGVWRELMVIDYERAPTTPIQ